MKTKKTENNKKLGFTLFELLVSISIIAVLTAVSVVSFGGLNKKTRDARRLADLEKIRVALESARQIGGTYPTSVANLVSSGFLDKTPVGPKNDAYVYVRDTNSTYHLCATVELVGSTTPNPAPTCTASLTGYVGYVRVVQP